MATVNLGSIKFKWKGTYSGATAYTVDDVVEYNGSSYICKLASTGNLPTNTTYFDVMSSAGTNGTNGTDLGTTLTTQGDIVYRDGSGLQRLGAGTAGQVLQTGGAGANPSWTAVSSDFVKLAETEVTSAVSSVSLDGYFSSTYRDYKIIGSCIVPDTTGTHLYWRIMEGGSEIGSADYKGFHTGSEWYNTGSGAGTQGNFWGYGDTKHKITSMSLSLDSGTAYAGANFEITLFNPLSTVHFKGYYQTMAYLNPGNMCAGFGFGQTVRQTAMSGARFYMSSGNISSGKFTLYGLK
jgi:hypothetical protein